MDATTYWKLKAAVMQYQNAQMKLEMLAAQAKQVMDQALHDAGLDPSKNYTMHDDTQSVGETAAADAGR